VKKVYAIVFIAVVVFGVLAIARPHTAAAERMASGIDKIRGGCRAAQSTIQSLGRDDTSVRTNRGRSYDEILKLMYAFNTRLANNNKSAPELSEITASFEKSINRFRTDYNAYKDSLDATVRIDCTSQPTTFYEDLIKARTRRNGLHEQVTLMNQLIDNYYATVEQILNGSENNATR
jgi:hypothetical protein